MKPDADCVAGLVDAASELCAIPLDAERRRAVIANMLRLAGFAADVAAVELPVGLEIAGEFRP